MSRMQRFVIDKITNSIEEVITGKSFETDIIRVLWEEIKTIHKKDGWFFNWKKEFKQPDRTIYKLVIQGTNKIQGLISLESVSDQLYSELHLIENAPHNYSDNKRYAGVAGNLVAFACKMSFDAGFDGVVAFTAKTNLIEHYRETLGAQLIYGQNRMAILTESARKLVTSYYKDHDK